MKSRLLVLLMLLGMSIGVSCAAEGSAGTDAPDTSTEDSGKPGTNEEAEPDCE